MLLFVALMLLESLPPLEDEGRFRITRFQINELLLLNRQLATRLMDVHQLNPQSEVIEAAIACDKLYVPWDHLRDSKTDWWTVADRRWALFKLRDEIGLENYAEAKMPPFVPLWAFREIGR